MAYFAEIITDYLYLTFLYMNWRNKDLHVQKHIFFWFLTKKRTSAVDAETVTPS